MLSFGSSSLTWRPMRAIEAAAPRDAPMKPVMRADTSDASQMLPDLPAHDAPPASPLLGVAVWVNEGGAGGEVKR